MLLAILLAGALVFMKIPKSYQPIVFFGLLLHLLLMIINTYFYPISLMSTNDPKNFLDSALLYVNTGKFNPHLGNGANYYVYFLSFLGTCSFMFKNLLLTGQAATILSWLISTLLLIKITEELHIENKQHVKLIIFLFYIMPYDIIITTGLFRDGIQLMFVLLASYFILKWNSCHKWRYLILFIVFSFVAGLWHIGVMIAMSILVIILSTAWLYNRFFKYRLSKGIYGGVILALLGLSYVIFYFLKYSYPSLFLHIADYSSKVGPANTEYPIFIGNGGFFDIILAWIYYMFYPFPWDIGNIVSLYAALLGFFRFLLLYFAVKGGFLEKNSSLQKKSFVLLLMFFLTTLVYAAGTANYGTSMRHHILTFWILVLLGVRGYFLKRRADSASVKLV